LAIIVNLVNGEGYLTGTHCLLSLRGKGTFLAPIVFSVCWGRVSYWHLFPTQSAGKGTLLAPIVVSDCGEGYLSGTHYLLSLLEEGKLLATISDSISGTHCLLSLRGRICYWHQLSYQSSGGGCLSALMVPISVLVCWRRVPAFKGEESFQFLLE